MVALVSEGIQSLSVYEPGKPVEELARELGISNAVKLASNENPLGPSPLAVEAIRGALGELHRYPDAANYRLKQRLSEHLRVDPGEILTGNGSNEILEVLVRTFCTPGDHLVFADPSFVVYRMVALAHGVLFTAVPLDAEARHDLSGMLRAVTDRTRVVFVANPNNPTGTHVDRSALDDFLRRVPPDVLVVVDEAYFEYADAEDYPDTLQMRACRERLATVRTFSKAYGLAALRVGYAVLPAELCDYANRVRAPFNVNGLAQVAATAALDDTEHLRASRALNGRERARVSAALQGLGLGVAPSQANFVFVDVARPGRQVYEALLKRGVIVRPMGQSSALRITIGLEEENDRMLEELAAVLG